MLQRTNRRTDIHLDPLIEIANEAAQFFGRELPGVLHKTGPIPTLAMTTHGG
jgi:hypothetical protein